MNNLVKMIKEAQDKMNAAKKYSCAILLDPILEEAKNYSCADKLDKIIEEARKDDDSDV